MLSKYTPKYIKKAVNKIHLFLFFFLFYSLITPTALSKNTDHPTCWKEITPGIAYTYHKNFTPNTLGYIHFFKINLNENQLKLALAKDDLFLGETVKWLSERNHALVGVNGGFFTPLWKPIGLRIQDGKVRSALQPTSWWHIFYLKNNKPYIISQKAYKPDSAITLAIQGGPRLIADGHTMRLKAGLAERTAIGITEDNQVILVATEHWALNTEELAKMLKKPESEGGFSCIQALNLDGGESTQLYANVGNIKLNVSSFALITDILYVTKNKVIF